MFYDFHRAAGTILGKEIKLKTTEIAGEVKKTYFDFNQGYNHSKMLLNSDGAIEYAGNFRSTSKDTSEEIIIPHNSDAGLAELRLQKILSNAAKVLGVSERELLSHMEHRHLDSGTSKYVAGLQSEHS